SPGGVPARDMPMEVNGEPVVASDGTGEGVIAYVRGLYVRALLFTEDGCLAADECTAPGSTCVAGVCVVPEDAGVPDAGVEPDAGSGDGGAGDGAAPLDAGDGGASTGDGS